MTQTADSTQQIRITLPDGSQREVAPGTTVLEVAESIGPRLAKAAARHSGSTCRCVWLGLRP